MATKYGENMTKLLSDDPINKVEAQNMGGRVRVMVDTIELVDEDDGDIVYLARLPRNAVIVKGELHHDACTGATDVDLGFPAVAAKKDLLMDGEDISSAGVSTLYTDHGTNGVDIDEMDEQLWKVLDYSEAADAPQNVDLGLTLNTATTASGPFTVTLMLMYVVD